MDLARIQEFIGNHLLLVLAFVGTLALFLAGEISRRLSGVASVGPAEAIRLGNQENALFLDTREDREYKEGHIAGAVHIPLRQLSQRLGELEKYRGRPVILYCRSGNRSGSAGRLLRKNGFENVYNLAGGIVAWQKADLPVTRK
ncbi:MAG TPA: rhodanese-like domain-containing protein [Gammaproteobacteria bacterium]|nr:rhodanese-like domain-containing protein [Gammaproteobacteria bacterium]